MLDIRKQLAVFNEEQGKKGGLQIAMGAGIATGRVVAGFAGTQSRATYICAGDIVNLSARLESHTKVAKKPIIIDEATRKALDTSVELEPLGEEIFKGKTVPVKIYSVNTAF
jgi:class 3 adenylate cyclase